MIIFLMFDCSKLVFRKKNTTKGSLMSVFTIPLCNGESMILFVNMWSIIVALVFVILVGLFITGKNIVQGLLLCFEKNLNNLY